MKERLSWLLAALVVVLATALGAVLAFFSNKRKASDLVLRSQVREKEASARMLRTKIEVEEIRAEAAISSEQAGTHLREARRLGIMLEELERGRLKALSELGEDLSDDDLARLDNRRADDTDP